MPDNNNGHHGLVLEFSGKPFSEPAAEKFDGAAILDRVSDFIRRYVHLSDPQARIVAVWVAHTHAISAATTTPYLNINSAVKQSGKTRLLEVLELLVAKPWLTGKVTAACLIRKVDHIQPTLLLDESDAAFQGEKEYAEALRGILNTGFYSGGVASCCVGQGANITYKDFRTYAAKAIAGIGSNLPDTVFDRSIPIKLIRKKPGEVVHRFRRRLVKDEAVRIKGLLEIWMDCIHDHLGVAQPVLPEQLTDRQQDGLEPLLAIADQAGGDWPEAVRKAAIQIFHSEAGDDQNISVRLLKDIKAVFREKAVDKIFSSDLTKALAEIETAPWSEWKHSKPISQVQLARQVEKFDIRPKKIRIAEHTLQGYEFNFFIDSWSRYVPEALKTEVDPEHVAQANVYAGPGHFSEPEQKPSRSGSKSEESPVFMRVVTDVPDQTAHRGSGSVKKAKPSPVTLPACPDCGGFAVFKTPDGDLECMTCEAR